MRFVIMKKTGLILIGLLVIIFLTGCTKPTNGATQTVNITSAQTSPYPAPQVEMTSNPSYPAPATQVKSNPGPTSTSDPQMGSVLGKLLINNSPVINISLYLAEVIKDASGRDIVAGLEPAKAPYAETDDQGNFAFINIPAGRYALILDVVINQYLLHDPNTNDPIIVQVESGNEVSLGDLNFDSLPLP
jgi:hypothetical protein